LKQFHFVFGIVAVLVFLLTGQYMAIYQGHLQGMAGMPRLLYRSRHIYILFASLLNLVLGAYVTRQPKGWRRTLQIAGSILIVTATGLLVAAFIYEPSQGQIEYTPFSFYGIILIAIGTITHVLGGASAKDHAAKY
jgi:hypothetical protein